MKFCFWDIGQLLMAGVVLSGILIEIVYQAHLGFILITSGSLIGFLIEKFRKKGD